MAFSVFQLFTGTNRATFARICTALFWLLTMFLGMYSFDAELYDR